MDDFDDFQTDAIEMGHFDFVEEMNEPIEKEDSFKFDDYLNSNIDY